MDYIHNISCEINDFLNDEIKRCLQISCTNSKNIQNIISTIESDYVFTDLFYNVDNEIDLLFLIRQQKNPGKRPAEYDAFINLGKTLNICKILSASTNIFKKDIVVFTQQIIKELRSINYSRICILLDCSNGISENLATVIHEISTNKSLNAKFILIGSNNALKCNYFVNAEYLQQMHVEFSIAYLKLCFINLTEEHIASLRIATQDNFQEMCNLYNYLINNSYFDINSDKLLQDIVESSLLQTFDSQTLSIFSIAAHLVEKFSLTELENIIKGENLNNIIFDEIDHILSNGVEKGILKEYDTTVYEFIISIVKNSLKNIRKKQKSRIHTAIESYLSKNRPFAYDIRYYHLQEANNSKKDRLIAIQFFNKLHFEKKIDYDTRLRFTRLFGETVTDTILCVYRYIKEGDYTKALDALSQISIDDNVIVQSEINYLEAYLLWKTVDKANAIKLLERKFKDIYDSDCEIETRVFTKLLQLSILSNESEYVSDTMPTPASLYKEISGLLSNSDSVDAKYLLNILRRKSNCALSRAAAINQVRESFKYFSLCKEYYPHEYLYSGTNYVALLLQSISSTLQISVLQGNGEGLYECRNAITVAESLLKEVSVGNTKVQAYIRNNYLIAKVLFDDNHISERELISFEKLICNISIDCDIMFNMNLGTFYATLNNFTAANKYWSKAQAANDKHDAYFNYIIDNNLFVADLIVGNGNVDIPNTIPMLVSNDAEIILYFNKRNAILKSLKDRGIRFNSFAEAGNYFEEEFSKTYNKMQLKLWSGAFLFSDVQFWSDN